MTVLWQSSGAGASKVLCMLCYIIPLIDSYHILHFYNYYMAERWGVLGGGWGALCLLIQHIPFKKVITQEYNNKLHTNIRGGGDFCCPRT